LNYSDIKILKTEYNDDYLLLYSNKTLLIGFIVKEIVELLQRNITSKELIKETILQKYNIVVDEKSVIETKEKIDDFLIKKNKDSFTRLFKLLNPSKIKFGILYFLFSKKFFFILFFFSFFYNLSFFFLFNNQTIVHFADKIIWCCSIFFILILHELGHSFSAQRYGVNSNDIGVGLYLFFPVFYINLGEIWKLSSFKRIIINLSGIYFQLIIGFILSILFIVYENIIFVNLFFSNFLIILVNLNPFIKFDGYWILSDIMNEKNLSKKSNSAIKSIVKMKFSENTIWLNTFSILRFTFLLLIIIYLTILLTNILVKFLNNTPLLIYDYLLIAIILTIIIKKIRK